MPQPKSRISRDILRDQGAPQKLSPDEQMSGGAMDDVDRSDWPTGEDVTANETPGNSKGSSGIQRKTGQFGTT